MKRFTNFSKRAKILTLGAVLALVAVAVPAVVTKAGPGPSRPTKVYHDGVAGFDHPTFNSFTNVPGIGDERNFFNGKYPTTGSVLSDPMPEVKDGDVLTLEVYVHNGADPSLNASGAGIAKNTKVRVALPTGVAKAQQATAYISADNAQPQTVTDTIDFGAANGGMFALEYVAGSAHAQGNFIDQAVSDSIVTSGAPIGTNALNGQMKGCFEELIYVTLKVRVKMPQYSLTKQVSVKGKTSTWTKTAATQVGDTARWMLTFKNNGETPLTSVAIADQVPAGLTVDKDSVVLTNGNYPNGYKFPASAVIDNGRTISINIGNYNPGILAYITYNTTVEKPAANICSTATLTNKAFATPSGFGAIYDTASITVPGNECKPTTPAFSCDLLTLTQGENRKVTASVAYTAKNGASFKTATFDWGNGTTPFTTSNTTASYQYSKDGTYTIVAKLLMSVNGTDTVVNGEGCAKQVTFSATTPPTTPPTELPNTGAGSVVGIIAGVSAVSALAYRLVLSRKLARR